MSLIIKAINYAQEAHKGQLRKDNKTPYITHPAEVAKTLCLHCETQYLNDILIASAWLHDVVEDTEHTHKDILYNFGQSVYQLVFDLTNKFKQEDKPTWNRAKRKRAEHFRLHNCSLEVQLVKASDRICNLRECGCLSKDFIKLYKEESRDLYDNLTKIHNLQLGGMMQSMLENPILEKSMVTGANVLQ